MMNSIQLMNHGERAEHHSTAAALPHWQWHFNFEVQSRGPKSETGNTGTMKTSSVTYSWLVLASPLVAIIANAAYTSSKLEPDAAFLLLCGVAAIIASMLSKHVWESFAIDSVGVTIVAVSGTSPLWYQPVLAEISARVLSFAALAGVDTGPGLSRHSTQHLCSQAHPHPHLQLPYFVVPSHGVCGNTRPLPLVSPSSMSRSKSLSCTYVSMFTPIQPLCV